MNATFHRGREVPVVFLCSPGPALSRQEPVCGTPIFFYQVRQPLDAEDTPAVIAGLEREIAPVNTQLPAHSALRCLAGEAEIVICLEPAVSYRFVHNNNH